ncbi:MAG: tetratricopeptide repeat protein [Promethearchaeota archaeon]|nr:MAG: tetratricopeptide repeat protein [Candidatus Lokiarchaeota archaeon]
MDPIYKGDFYIKNQYADLYKRNRIIKKLEVERNYKALVKEYNSILNIIEKSNDALKLGITYNLLGVALSYIGDVENAIKNAKKSLILIEPLDDKFLIAEINYNLACFYCLKGSKQEAINYFQKVIRNDNEFSKFFKESAKKDPQLEECRKNPDFFKLL